MTNLYTSALNGMSDAAAHATLTLAKSKRGLFEDGSRKAARDKAKAKKFDGKHASR